MVVVIVVVVVEVVEVVEVVVSMCCIVLYCIVSYRSVSYRIVCLVLRGDIISLRGTKGVPRKEFKHQST